MKITAVESIPVDRYLFAKVHTDAGLTGVGESGAWGFLEASQAAIDKLGRYLGGEDPLRIEHHWQYMYRFSHFRGAAIMGAISALDIALWDIAGKHFGVPVYQLMGGKTRDKARVYCHVFGDTREKLVQGVKDAREAGFTAVGHLTPFLDEPVDKPFFKTHAENMRGAIEAVAAYREAAGDDVDLCIEIHRRLTPAEAVTLAKGIEPYHPLFYDPTALSAPRHRSSCSATRWRPPSYHPPPEPPDPPTSWLPPYARYARTASAWPADALCRTSTGYCGRDAATRSATGTVSGPGRQPPASGTSAHRS